MNKNSPVLNWYFSENSKTEATLEIELEKDLPNTDTEGEIDTEIFADIETPASTSVFVAPTKSALG